MYYLQLGLLQTCIYVGNTGPSELRMFSSTTGCKGVTEKCMNPGRQHCEMLISGVSVSCRSCPGRVAFQLGMAGGEKAWTRGSTVPNVFTARGTSSSFFFFFFFFFPPPFFRVLVTLLFRHCSLSFSLSKGPRRSSPTPHEAEDKRRHTAAYRLFSGQRRPQQPVVTLGEDPTLKMEIELFEIL